MALVDIGHSSAAVAVVKYTLLDAQVQARVLAAAAEVGAGGGALDTLLLQHFEAQIDAKFGVGTCKGPKAQCRLLKACERVKKMLSTVDCTKVSVDGLIPDQDVSIELTRGQLELMAVPVCRRVSELVTRVLGTCDFGANGGSDGGIDVVEVVGGGTRMPCMADAVQEAAGGVVLSKTLDSNTALCQGSWAAAMARFPAEPGAGGEGGGVREGAVEQALQELGEFGMGDAAREALVAMFRSVQAEQERQRGLDAALNAVYSLLSEARAALAGNLGHVELLQKAETEKLISDTEEWLYNAEGGGEGGGHGLDALVSRKKSVEEQLRALNQAFYDRLDKEKQLAAEQMEAEAGRRRAEEAAAGEKEDHDSRPLKFDDRMRLAENNKKEGNELFRDGNIMHALERYTKALAHCFKVVGDMNKEQQLRLSDCKGSLSLNLAQCYFKLDKWQKTVDSSTLVLQYLNTTHTTYNADPDSGAMTPIQVCVCSCSSVYAVFV